MSIVAIGVDIGKRKDPTALVIVEYEQVMLSGEAMALQRPRGLFDPLPDPRFIEPEYDTRYLVRSLGRLPLGTSYPDVALHINRVCKNIRVHQPKADQYLLIDQTGVGAGVVDMMKRLLDPAIHLTAVTFTGTDHCDSAPLHRPEVSMGKAYMVSRLQAFLQNRMLQLPKSPLAEALILELKQYEVRVQESGHEKYGAFSEGTTDDLVSALGMACLGDCHEVVGYRPPLYQ